MPEYTVEQIFQMIEIAQRQLNVAKQRGEYDVVAYHQSQINSLRLQIPKK